MQLKNSFMWSMYKRYYAGSQEMPAPGNICNYFWKSLGGLIKCTLYDLNIFIVIPLFALISFLTIFNGLKHPTVGGLLGVLAGFFMAVFTYILFLYRVTERIKKKSEALSVVFFALTVYLTMIIMISFIFVEKNGNWEWIYLLYSFYTTTGVILFAFLIPVIIFLFSEDSPIYPFFSSVKRKICIEVNPPKEIKK